MPQEIRELREEIYDVSDFKTAIDRIVLRFGYPDGLPPRWELYGLPLGQDAASVVFLCEDGSSREMTVSREEEYLNRLVFSSGALGCRMLPKSIENIFVDREFY